MTLAGAAGIGPSSAAVRGGDHAGLPPRRGADGLWRIAGRAMGSPLGLTVRGEADITAVEEAWAAVMVEFEAAEQAMSRFRATSDVTRANLAPGFVTVDPRLRRALVAADRARRMTGGAFDGRILSALEALEALGSLGSRAVDVGRPEAIPGPEPTVRVRRDGAIRIAVPIDLGGIGKGLALRWAGDRIDAVLPAGIGWLLDAGGDIRLRGPGPTDGLWVVAIEPPSASPGRASEAGPLAMVALSDGAISTSSVRINSWLGRDGTPVHHLVDPATGRPGGGGLRSVTVALADPAWAEVRTKQLFLAGPRGIATLARRLDLAAWWVGHDDVLEMTPAARQSTLWVAAEA